MAHRNPYLLPAIGTGAAVAVGIGVGVKTVLGVQERPSWPPPPDAITSGSAMAAVSHFASGDPVPGDVGLPYAWSTAATIEPWGGGAEFYPRLFSDIEAARESIHILMFGWKPGVPAGMLVELLERKLQDGTAVRILVDEYGSRPYGQSAEMYRGLAAAGAQIIVNGFLPPRRAGRYPDAASVWRGSAFARADHRKLYVVDGTVAWIGGAGIEDHFHDGRFFDVMVRVTGDVVRQSQAVFLTSFASHQGPLPAELTPLFPEQPVAGATPVVVTQVVNGGHVSATQAARELIDESTRRLDIMNPYLTDDDMVERIIAAARRGVRVRVVVSQRSNNAPATFALRHRYTEFAAVGIEVWEYPDAVVHAKLIVADDQVQFGTLNLDAWSLYRSYEIAMIARSGDTAELFRDRIFEPAIARCTRGEQLATARDRALAALASRITYFL